MKNVGPLDGEKKNKKTGEAFWAQVEAVVKKKYSHVSFKESIGLLQYRNTTVTSKTIYKVL